MEDKSSKRQIRLLSISNYYYLGFLFVLLALWSIVCYEVIRFEVYENIDEVLLYRKHKLLLMIQKNEEIPANSEFNDFRLTSMGQMPSDAKDVFRDTLLKKDASGFDECRELVSYIQLKGQVYRINLILPRMAENEMLETIIFTIPSLFCIMLVGLWGLSTLLNHRLWRPFEQLTSQIRHYRFDKDHKIDFEESRIKEFVELQKSIQSLTRKNLLLFQQQKQFTENASHEIQTPLSIIQSKLELLFQEPLNEYQASLVESLFMATGRLSKINETLLLLTKIENRQFDKKEVLYMRDRVEELLPYFEERISEYQLQVVLQISESCVVEANSTLLEILMSNLLKNAFVHNKPYGRVSISMDAHCLVITNTGNMLSVAPEKLFERFFRSSGQKGGVGLGLSIVKSICELYDWQLSYRYDQEIHEITINFNR